MIVGNDKPPSPYLKLDCLVRSTYKWSESEGISIDEFSGADSAAASSSHALNRLKWSADGRMAVASGDKMHVLGVGDDVWKTKGDEEGKVMNNLLSRGLIQE